MRQDNDQITEFAIAYEPDSANKAILPIIGIKLLFLEFLACNHLFRNIIQQTLWRQVKDIFSEIYFYLKFEFLPITILPRRMSCRTSIVFDNLV